MPKRVCYRCAMGHNCDIGPVCHECQKHIASYRRIFRIESDSFTNALLQIDKLYGLETYPVSPRLRENNGKWVFVYYGCDKCAGVVKDHKDVEYSPEGFIEGGI